MANTTTKRAKTRARAKTKVKAETELSPKGKATVRIKITNLEYLNALDKAELSDALEYLYLTRLVQDTICVPVKGHDTGWCWGQVENTPYLKASFDNLNRSRGFMSKWLTDDLYSKLHNADKDTWGRFLTEFSQNHGYRHEIAIGKKHRIYLSSGIEEGIGEWLNEM